MAALVESKATALNKGNKKYSYITDFFDIQHVAGRGSFGTVFQALLRCEYDSRPRGTGSTASNLALKKISLSSGQSIIKEIDALHTLRGHRNVVELLYCIICEDEIDHVPSVYLVFPFFQSATPYNEYVQNITAIEFNAYMLQLFLALEFIHFKGLLHRDLKPSNVLFDRHQLRLNVVDFGLSKRVLSHDDTIVPRVGTFGYRAPEVLFGSPIQTAAMDVWSAGQICLNLLTGRCDWFYYKRDLPSRQAMDAFNIAQLCSMLGSAVMKEAACALKMELRCIFPANTPLFPSQAQPIPSLLVLRNDASQFDLFFWKIVERCWQPNPFKRSTASSIVSTLNAYAQGSGEAALGHDHSTKISNRDNSSVLLMQRCERLLALDKEIVFESKYVTHGLIEVISSEKYGVGNHHGGGLRTAKPAVEYMFTHNIPWRFFFFEEKKSLGGFLLSPFQKRRADAGMVEKQAPKHFNAKDMTGKVLCLKSANGTCTTSMQIVSAVVPAAIGHASDIQSTGYCGCCNKFFKSGAKIHMNSEHHRAAFEKLVSFNLSYSIVVIKTFPSLSSCF